MQGVLSSDTFPPDLGKGMSGVVSATLVTRVAITHSGTQGSQTPMPRLGETWKKKSRAWMKGSQENDERGLHSCAGEDTPMSVVAFSTRNHGHQRDLGGIFRISFTKVIFSPRHLTNVVVTLHPLVAIPEVSLHLFCWSANSCHSWSLFFFSHNSLANLAVAEVRVSEEHCLI